MGVLESINDTNRAVALDLLRNYEREARASGDFETADSLRRSLESAAQAPVEGALYRESSDGPVAGIATWMKAPRGVGVNHAYLGATLRSTANWKEFLDELFARPIPPVLFTSQLLGLTPADVTRLMTAHRMSTFARFEMKFPDSLAPPSVPRPSGVSVRAPHSSDAAAIAQLNYHAYRGTIDSALFAEIPDPEESARQLTRRLFEGEWGSLRFDLSRVAEAGTSLVGACLLNEYHGPLIIEAMVEPAFQGRGIGASLIAEVVSAARRSGLTGIRLNVTRENGSAFRLYQRLGFVVSLGPFELWADVARLGVSRQAGVSSARGVGVAGADSAARGS